MSSMERMKTAYPGVFHITSQTGEKIFYVRYRRPGTHKLVEEKIGGAITSAMTAAKANAIRVRRISGEKSNDEFRKEQTTARRWPIKALWDEYRSHKGLAPDKPIRKDGLTRDADFFTFYKHLKDPFGKKHPPEITSLEVARFTNAMLRKFKPQTVKHALTLLVRLTRFGFKHQLTPLLPFPVEYPKFDNKVTNPLDEKGLAALMAALEEYPDPTARGFVLVALLTGMRRGSILKLKWNNLDFESYVISLDQPKGTATGTVETLPMSKAVADVFKAIPRSGSEYVFPGKNEGHMVDGKWAWKRIKEKAGLTMRYHDLRHSFATLVAQSGKVDLRELQRLLSHKSMDMTLRYAHLLDGRVKTASNAAGEVIEGLTQQAGSLSELVRKQVPKPKRIQRKKKGKKEKPIL